MGKEEVIEFVVGSQPLLGHLFRPVDRRPGVLLAHGWGGNQDSYFALARLLSALGCICVTFDFRGHAATELLKLSITPAENYADLLAAYDRLAEIPDVDPDNICVLGSSYGGYLGALLTRERKVARLGLRAPAMYADADWDTPKLRIDRAALTKLRMARLTPAESRALQACSGFRGDVLLVESETDAFVPREVIASYRNAFTSARSLTHKVLEGSDHGLSQPAQQRVYRAVVMAWVEEHLFPSVSDIGDAPADTVRATER